MNQVYLVIEICLHKGIIRRYGVCSSEAKAEDLREEIIRLKLYAECVDDIFIEEYILDKLYGEDEV